jgi:hypothetical protein
MLAAGDIIEVEGKQYRLRPVRVQSLCDLEKDALAFYKRQYLTTFKENADLIGVGDEALAKKLDEVARWGLEDLPKREAFDCSSIPVTDALKSRLLEHFETEIDNDMMFRLFLSTALDTERITVDEVRQLTGKGPRRGLVRYDQWWITSCVEGMVAFIYSSIRQEHPELTRSDVANWTFAKLTEASSLVERLTVASVGNG